MTQLLYKVNPLIKIIVFIIITLLVTFDQKPYLSLALILLSLVASQFFSGLSLNDIFNKSKFLIIIAIMYGLFVMLSRWLSGLVIDMEYILALSLRFIVFSVYAVVFVETVLPSELLRSLTKYFKMPESMAFAFLAAYRFIPNFMQEFQQVKYSRAVRGIDNDGFFSAFTLTMKSAVPLLVTSIRRGIRLSISMETKAMGKYSSRTYYEDISIRKVDWWTMIVFITYIILTMVILKNFDLLNFSWTYSS